MTTTRSIVNVQPPPAPAAEGNTRAVSHGATSEQVLQPLREEFAIELRHDYPHLDARRLAILADRLARLESARRWLDRQRGVVRNRRGEVWPVADRIEKWASTAELRLREAEEERRGSKPAGLAEALALEERSG